MLNKGMSIESRIFLYITLLCNVVSGITPYSSAFIRFLQHFILFYSWFREVDWISLNLFEIILHALLLITRYV